MSLLARDVIDMLQMLLGVIGRDQRLDKKRSPPESIFIAF